MKVALMPNMTREKAIEMTTDVCKELAALGIEYIFSDSQKDLFLSIPGAVFLPDEEFVLVSDFVLSVGGDGSMIHAAKRAAINGKMILGVNAGRLAYLCGVDADELHMLRALVTKEYTIERRMLLRVDHYDNGMKISSNYCVNDLVVSRGRDMRLVDVVVHADGKHIANYISDGVIIATPTGSTAYSLAAGGPIAEPTLEALLLTPICPHQLNLRPFIFRADTVLELTTGKSKNRSKLYLSCDGEPSVALSPRSVLAVTRAGLTADFIKIKSVNFVDVLNNKLALNR